MLCLQAFCLTFWSLESLLVVISHKTNRYLRYFGCCCHQCSANSCSVDVSRCLMQLANHLISCGLCAICVQRRVQYKLAVTVHRCLHLRLRNDLYCVEWGVKLYSLTHPLSSPPSSIVPHRPLRAGLRGLGPPAPAICELPSTHCSTCSSQHHWSSRFCRRRPNSLELAA